MAGVARALAVLSRLAGAVGVERIERRVQRMDSDSLVAWVDTSIIGVGRAYGDWVREGQTDSLDEARMGAASLVVVLEELEDRRQTGRL